MHSNYRAFPRLLTAAATTLLCLLTWTCGGDTVTGPTATQLAFSVGPVTTTGGATLAPALKVEARDASGNVVVTFSGTITVALGTNPSGATLSGTKTAPAISGVATFADLSVDKVGTGYTLTATTSTLTGATSAAFDINPGPAARLAFGGQPSNATAGVAIAPSVTVTAQDLGGNLATGFTGNITVAITNGTGTAGATLSGATTLAATGGVATYSTLTVDKTGTGYTLTGTATGLTAATSGAFAIAAGPVAQLAFTVQPSTTVAGTAITPAVKVTAQDALGNTVTSFAATISVVITGGTGTAGATLSGTTTVAATSGIATFTGLSIDKAGRISQGTGYTLSASSGVLTTATSDPFDINVGAPAALTFTTQPVSGAAGAGFSPLVAVSALDGVGNLVTTFTGNITVAIGTNPSGASLGGTNTVAAIAGVATFSTIHIDSVGTGYTLAASAAAVTGATSGPFDITPGPAAELVFTVQPVTTSDLVHITPAVKVTARDAFGNVATPFAGNVSMAITTNPSAGTLSGTTTLAASAGVATFADLSIDNIGTGYQLGASASGLVPDTSAAFDIVASAAHHLVFTTQPVTTTAGAAITPSIAVSARDAGGQPVTSFTGNVTLAITNGTGAPGGVLAGTVTVAAVNGTATFPGLHIDQSASGYTLTGTATGLQSAISAPFTISAGTAAQLVFAVEPSTVTAAATITPQIEVVAHDALGNIADGFSGNVTLAIANNPSGGTLSGTTVVAAVAGVAAFTDLSINLAGVGYTLAASATGPSGATSAAFDVSAAAAANLSYTVEPSNAIAGANIAPAIKVTAKDSLGNVQVGFTGNVTLTITAGSGTAGAVLAGTHTVAAVAGVATFSDLNIDKAGTGYTFSATATGLAGATSAAFDITSGAAAKLAFTVEPATTVAGVAIAPAVTVTAQDIHGNTVTTYTAAVALAIGVNPGVGTLSGTSSKPAVAGVATFSDLSIDKSGAGYTLSASSGALTGTTSAPFDITAAAATLLEFFVQPSTSAAGVAIAPTIQVVAKDALGNTASSFTGNVTMVIATNPPGTGVLSGTTVVAAAAGVASFGNLSINRSGVGYTISASAPGLGAVVSAPFTITPGAATTLVFSVQPTTATTNANIAPAVKVAAQDAAGNVATTFNGNITVNLGSNPGGGTLSGTRTLAAVNGVASYQALSLNNTGTGYTLTAAAGGLTGATSAPFNIIPSVGTQLFFQVNPANTTVSGATISPSVVVTARDASGQTASSYTGNVTLAITSGTGSPGATLAGTTAVAAVSGVATFANLFIDKSGVGYKLTATAAGLTSATSAFFTITPGPATTLVFTLQPSTATAEIAITPKVEVTARDTHGNTATGFTDSVTVAIGTNPAAGALAGAVKVPAVGGIASFSTLSIDSAGIGYTLTAASGALTGATSAPFNISATLATQLTFSTQPSAATAGVVIAPAVRVTARNASGGVATGFTGNVTLTITAGTGTAGATLSGTVTQAAVAGIATFNDLSIDNSGTGYRLSATAAGVSGITSAPFTINAGAPTRVTFTVQPGTATAATFIPGSNGPSITATARDALGNPVKTFVGAVSIALAINPPGGTLSGTQTVNAVAGVATFNDLALDKSANGYRLLVSSTGLTADTSDAFTITAGAATQMIFTVQPSPALANAAITPPIRITALDAQGNVATGLAGNVTLTIATNPSSGTLAGVTTVAFANGVAVFSGLSINNAGVGYVLKASATGLPDVLSATFTIN
jgi:hypothetical protein